MMSVRPGVAALFQTLQLTECGGVRAVVLGSGNQIPTLGREGCAVEHEPQAVGRIGHGYPPLAGRDSAAGPVDLGLAVTYRCGFPRDEGLPEPVWDLHGLMLRVGSDPDVPAFASGEKAGGVDEVVPHDEAAAAHFDHLGDQGELVIQASPAGGGCNVSRRPVLTTPAAAASMSGCSRSCSS